MMTRVKFFFVGLAFLSWGSSAWGEAIWWGSGMVKLRAANGGTEGDPLPADADLCSPEGCLKGGVRISAAQNEFEPFQIFIAADEKELKNVDVTVDDLVHKTLGSPPDNQTLGSRPGDQTLGSRPRDVADKISARLPGPIMIYREHYIHIARPTDGEARPGAWPDPLIPKVDEYFGEPRSIPGEGRPAFPFDVPQGRKQAIWVDVYIPPQSAPGDYTGSATITVDRKKAATIPIRLSVHPFQLPSTSSLRTAYAVGITELGKGHDWDDPRANRNGFIGDERTSELICLYTKGLLLHRLTNESVIWPPPRWDKGEGKVRWKFPEGKTTCPEKYPEFLNGINDLPGGKLKGTRITSVRLRDGYGFNDPDRYDPSKLNADYYKGYVAYFKEQGWLDRLFDYTRDEPKFGYQRSTRRRECWNLEDSKEKPDTDWDKIKRRSAFLHRVVPDLKLLVTTDRQAAESCFERLFDEPSAQKYIDIWTVGIKRMDGKPDADTYNRNFRPTYDRSFIGPGKELWWYHACGSHGCGDGSERGWPTVMVDLPSIYARIFEWLTYDYHIAGELYYETVFQYPYSYKGVKGPGGQETKVPDRDPFENVYYFGGNGDGVLFYPGRPDRIGGTRHIPIESIRLKMIREGMEDYEYLKLAEAKKGRAWIEAEVLPLLKEDDRTPLNVYHWTHRPERLAEAREKLAAALR